MMRAFHRIGRRVAVFRGLLGGTALVGIAVAGVGAPSRGGVQGGHARVGSGGGDAARTEVRGSFEASGALSIEPRVETAAEKDARMAWWREARFGMFIHWGLYAIPAGQWGERTNHAEWIRTTAQIPLEEYDKFVAQFNPVKFDADAWAKMAADAGMKYIVITSKHHDGFALFDSKVSDFDVMATPFQRDILKELAEACRRHGLKMCFYHSIMDWHHPDYLPRRDWETNRSSEGADFKRFEAYLHAQVTELLTHYGPIGVMWFDGEWESTWTHEHGRPLYDLCRKLQPSVIVNNRVDKGRAGMAGMTIDDKFAGDFGTPEQEVPHEGLPGVDWESCITMNQNWGYNRADKNFKSTRDLIRMLVDIASKGGNLLLNIGPTAEGEFPPESVERLAAIGKWMKVHGESIYGTQAGPFRKGLAWGRCTMKPVDGGARLYLHVFDWPADGRIVVPGLGNEVRKAYVLSAPASPLEFKRVQSDVHIGAPSAAPDADCPVVALEIAGKPVVYEAPTITAAAQEFVTALSVELSAGSPEVEVRYTLDGGEPAANSLKYAGPIRIDATTTVKARSVHDGKVVSGTSAMTFKKVTPHPAAAQPSGLAPGLRCEVYEGEWDRLPDFAKLKPASTTRVSEVSLEGGVRAERQGRRYLGFLVVPKDEAYTFALTSDDGAKLLIDGVCVVDNDGLHVPVEKRGTIALEAGVHALEVAYFNKTGGAELELRWGALGEALEKVPAAAFASAEP